MKILIAEDEVVSRCMLEELLAEWGHEVLAVGDGSAAFDILQGEESPRLAILDWNMPGLPGIEVCRSVRAMPRLQTRYLILLTANEGTESIVVGLEAGANDYLTKPFNPAELRARLNVGRNMVELQTRLADRVRELEHALAHVKQLQSFLPICCYCKKIRNDNDYWEQVESYITTHAGTQFSHAICPPCLDRVMKETMEGKFS
jgi:phosphoserine phosphatase RsbU/P